MLQELRDHERLGNQESGPTADLLCVDTTAGYGLEYTTDECEGRALKTSADSGEVGEAENAVPLASILPVDFAAAFDSDTAPCTGAAAADS
jgi:hypothetical protein